MAMKKAQIGSVTLATGVTASGISGIHEQSATKSSKGDLKVYKDKDGNDIAVYVTDVHGEYSFEALIESDVEDKEIGDVAQIGGINGVITQWDVVENNEDVKLVRGGIRSFPDLA